MYSVGQAENLLSAGRVQYPQYNEIGSLEKDQYPCVYTPPKNANRPKSIPLGTYDDYSTANYIEPYVHETQQKSAGEFSDRALLIIMIVLFAILCFCTFLSFQK